MPNPPLNSLHRLPQGAALVGTSYVLANLTLEWSLPVYSTRAECDNVDQRLQKENRVRTELPCTDSSSVPGTNYTLFRCVESCPLMQTAYWGGALHSL